MGRLVILLVTGSLVIGQVSAQKKDAKSDGSSRVERELKQLEREWDDAIVQKDLAALKRILSDDFVFIDEAGGINRKADIIAAIESPDLAIEPFETEDVVVRVYGDTAILTGHFRQKGKYKGRSFAAHYRYTDVYVRQKEGWKAVSAHASLLKG
ncbi:MAG TPA: nuclear transport factor 2 family protein [Blastocatellia bacterium]|nr:nuclear transport factor 2 family protein [Blastocatellia bacterium]